MNPGGGLLEKFKDEVLQKYKVEDSARETYRGRGAPSEWRTVRRVNEYQSRKWGGDCWARIFSGFREYILQRKQGMQEGQTEEENQQQRMRIMKEVTRNIRAKGRKYANSSWWVSEFSG